MYLHLHLLQYDLLSAWRHKSDWINSLVFFVLVTTLFPLCMTPNEQILHLIAPGLIWISALLSMLIGLPQFLKPDYQDGSLNFMLLSPHALPMLVLTKLMAHWIISGLPLIITTPLLALLLHLSGSETLLLMLTLLCGTPIFSLIGGIANALTLSLNNASFLLALLVLPLCVPILIFGTGAIINLTLGFSIQGPLCLMLAFLMLSVTLAPMAISAALKFSEN